MHQFWNTITKIKDTDAYSFKLDKKKCRVDTEVFREILQICPRILNQDFIAPPSEEDLVTFIQELGYSGRCNMLSANHTDQMHQPWRTFAAIISRVLPRKQGSIRKLLHLQENCLLSKKAEPIKKGKRVKRPAKKSTTAPTAGVVLRDTPGVPVSKKKAPAKGDRSKGIEILSDVALSEATQLKEATKRSKKDFHISQAYGSSDGTDLDSGVPEHKTSGTDEGTSTKLGVPDVPTYDSESENESWGHSEDDNDDDSKGEDVLGIMFS
ncbi:hypothetical protein Tco_0390141 [Tanacetum coccineum]